MNKRGVVVMGDANVDLVIRLPDKAHDLTGSEPQLFGGGTAGNVAVGLARLGVLVTFIGTVGDDGFGRWAAADLAREGIDTSGLIMLKDAFTPQVIALIQPDGERHLVVFPTYGGADKQLTPAHIDAETIQTAAWLHTTGIVLRHTPSRDAVLHAMRLARAAGVTVSLDLNLRIELWGFDDTARATIMQAVALADYVFGNGEEELIPIAGGGSVEAAARRLRDGDTRVIVARLGSRGALVIDADGVVYTSPARAIHVVDTVGAGDAFNVGFIDAILRGGDVTAAAEMGNAVAAYKIGRMGARSLPTRAELTSI